MINGRNEMAKQKNGQSVDQTACDGEQMMPADMVMAPTTKMTSATWANGLPSGGNKNNVRARECNDESEPRELTSGPRTNAEATNKTQTVANAIGNNALMLGQVQGIFHKGIDNTLPSQTLRVFANQMNCRVRIRGSKNWLVIKTPQVIMVPTNTRRKRQIAIPQVIVDTNNWFNNQRMPNGTNQR